MFFRGSCFGLERLPCRVSGAAGELSVLRLKSESTLPAPCLTGQGVYPTITKARIEDFLLFCKLISGCFGDFFMSGRIRGWSDPA
ncbi:MAG: hypothetical protein MPL62_01680 [Alphaproteobacteria bacterium]|nr:hypothetical protein [Alphaproteobacteria bacterium]